MKTNDDPMFRVTLIFLLVVGGLLVGGSAQAQNHEQNHEQEHISFSSDTRVPISAKQQALEDEATQFARVAATDLHRGKYAEAEEEARQAQSLNFLAGIPEEILAEALDGQGKDKEALEAYHVVLGNKNAGYPRDLLPYALLLLKSGQWEQALAAYNAALPGLPTIGLHPEIPIIQDEDLMRANSHFSADVPETMALATAIHIAHGLVYNVTPDWAGESQNMEAVAEYGKALKLAPDSPLANYYFGVGWQKLSPAERVKAGGSVQQAKAALRKAVLLGKGDVKRAAEKALKDLKKPA